MRVYALYLIVAFLSLYAYRYWFRSLCGLILLMAVIERPDMPKSILDVQGLNPWNFLMANVLIGWMMNRRHERLVWDMPRHISIAMILYLFVIVVGFLRLLLVDHVGLQQSPAQLISETLVNTIKWIVPGILLFDGTRDRRRLMLGIASIVALYLLMSAQVVRSMPYRTALSGDTLTEKSRNRLSEHIGFHAIDAALMLSGGAWAVLATLPLVRRRYQQALVVGAFLVVTYALALTGGRTGYGTWGVVGLILCLLRWRKRLLLVPLLVLLAVVVTPGAVERMLQGFDESAPSGRTHTDLYTVTSGRTLIWPYVIDKIDESPLFGHGREAMTHTGLVQWLGFALDEGFGHPHNAYLECALDNGIVGLLVALALFGILVVHAIVLFRDRSNPWHSAVGGIALALMLALLVAGIGSHTFYPREETVGMWAAIGLLLRLSVAQRGRLSSPVRTARAFPGLVTGRKQPVAS